MLQEFQDKYKVRIGFLPTRRKIFSKEEAGKFKRMIEAKIKTYDCEIVNIDFLNEEGLIYEGMDADVVADAFIAAKVDAVFAPHCNFGTEDAVAKTAKKVGKPLLLWGPRDDAPQSDGIRPARQPMRAFCHQQDRFTSGRSFYLYHKQRDRQRHV